ncbi:hypothetical protein [Mesorhizobium sp. RIZ17]|uniref:hypothetical protein n=1 Tax=Mesorhizobium sp. RIZ17 TaxID=3132743 RepID=UPI003DA93F03
MRLSIRANSLSPSKTSSTRTRASAMAAKRTPSNAECGDRVERVEAWLPDDDCDTSAG